MSKVKVYVNKDELWPYYQVCGNKFAPSVSDIPCEFTEEQLAFINKAIDDFEKAQEMLEKAYEQSGKQEGE